MPPFESGKAGEWAFYYGGNKELLATEIERCNKSTYLLTNGKKIHHRHIWLVLKNDDDIHQARHLSAFLNIEAIWRIAAGETLSAADLGTRVQEAKIADDAWHTAFPDTPPAASVIQLAVAHIALTAPFYFRRAGGRLMPATAQEVAGALSSIDKRAALEGKAAALEKTLSDGKIPEDIVKDCPFFLLGKKKHTPSAKALKKIAGGFSPEILADFFITRGVLADTRDYWRTLFNHEWQLPDNPQTSEKPTIADFSNIPLAKTQAFSIDEKGTTEVDDAFSISDNGNGNHRIGIHIAAPALTITIDSAIDIATIQKMVSVYFPDEKHPMLSSPYISAHSLKKGGVRPALSIYFLFDQNNGRITEETTCLENVFLADEITPAQADSQLMTEQITAAYDILLVFATHLPPSPIKQEKRFIITADPPAVRLSQRGNAELAVEAMMRLANSTWAKKIIGHGGLFRSNGMITTTPAKDEKPYAWFTSPLRRYPDLVNQRLLLSLLAGKTLPLEKWQQLTQKFNERHTLAKHYQKAVERHYALLALQQGETLTGKGLKNGRVRLDNYPLSAKVDSFHAQEKEAVSVRVTAVNLITQKIKLEKI